MLSQSYTKFLKECQPNFSHIETLILYRIVLPLMYSIQRNAAFLHQHQQYFRAGLRRGAISTYHFNKLVLQPAQASVHADRIPAQAGEVRHQQKISFTSGHRTGNLGQPPCGRGRGIYIRKVYCLEKCGFQTASLW